MSDRTYLNSSKELKDVSYSCPKCGRFDAIRMDFDADYEYPDYVPRWTVECQRCEFRGPSSSTPDDACYWWNVECDDLEKYQS